MPCRLVVRGLLRFNHPKHSPSDIILYQPHFRPSMLSSAAATRNITYERTPTTTTATATTTTNCTATNWSSNNNRHYPMLVLGERDVQKALDPQTCLEINRRALIALADGTGVVPTRLGLSYPNNPNRTESSPHSGSTGDVSIPSSSSSTTTTTSQLGPQDWTLIKPAAYYGDSRRIKDGNEGDNLVDDSGMAMGLKVVSVRAANPTRGLPLVPATIFLVEPASGIVVATVAGTHLTVMRTSAGPALAVRAFQPKAQELVIFGAGAQAECHIRLMELALQRRIPKITIINRTIQRAQALRTKLMEERNRKDDGPTVDDSSTMLSCNKTQPCVIEAVALDDVDAVSRALSTADVVAATTNTSTPLFDGPSMTPPRGCLITGIGSYTPDMQEIPEFVVNRSVVIIDTPEAMQVGDLKHLGVDDTYLDPTKSPGRKKHPVYLAGDALAEPTKITRQILNDDDDHDDDKKQYIFYKAVGTAIQDILTAQAVLEKANELGIGQKVDMS